MGHQEEDEDSEVQEEGESQRNCGGPWALYGHGDYGQDMVGTHGHDDAHHDVHDYGGGGDDHVNVGDFCWEADGVDDPREEEGHSIHGEGES